GRAAGRLHKSLEGLGSRLIFARGSSRDLIIGLMEKAGANMAHVSRSYGHFRLLGRRIRGEKAQALNRSLRLRR
ncbi:MAG: hypothetical protein ACR2QJ_15215, partial [Geminicoccaceae bacterium]